MKANVSNRNYITGGPDIPKKTSGGLSANGVIQFACAKTCANR
jgi:hypothetical protein